MKKIVLITITLFISIIVYSQAVGDIFVENFITYEVTTITPNTVKITDYNNIGGTEIYIHGTVSNGFTNFSVTSIDPSVFANKSLTIVTIPNTVVTIGAGAFFNNQLTGVSIPNSVTSLGNSVFKDNLLTSVIIGTGISNLPTGVFQNNKLTNITIPNTVTSIGNQVFFKNKLTSVIIPNSVISIGSIAFNDNNLTSVTISNSITSIGSSAFSSNPSLTNVVSLSMNPPVLSSSVFSNSSNNGAINLKIPVGTSSLYTAAQWTGFLSVTEDAALSISNFELTNEIRIATTANTIKIISDDSVNLQNYTIYNISGVEVSKGNENIIPTSFLSNGMYILKLNFDKGEFTKKFVK